MSSQLLILFLLVLINAFFSASEIALISLNDNKIKAMAEEGDVKAIKLNNLLKEPGKFLAAIQIGITFAGFLASAIASESFADKLVILSQKISLSISPQLLKSLSMMLITIILSYFTLVLGELVPKRIAMKKYEEISKIIVGPLSFLAYITSPFVKFLNFSSNIFLKLFRIDPDKDDSDVTEEEIRMMISIGEEKGTIEEIEKELINNIFDFNDKYTKDIMTHRTNVVALSNDAILEEIIPIIHQEKYTRFPIYKDSIDNIIGILHVKDLIQYIIDYKKNDDFSLDNIIRKPYFVPDSKPIDELFRELKLVRTHLVVVIDEYGGTAGIITIEDLLEEIVGNILDEYDDEETNYKTIDEKTFIFNGAICLDDVEKILDIELPVDDYDTLSGFVISLIGRIPEENEKPTVNTKGLTLTVEKIQDKKIAIIKVIKQD
ncbi:MAG: hemolysin family protein [Eubacteriaceae bacterium]